MKNMAISAVAVASITVASILRLATPAMSEPECGLPGSFVDPHRVLYSDNALFWARPLLVDADGAPNAYHRDDPHGRKGLAIEYIGHGMSIERNGEEIPFNFDEEDNGEWLRAYRRIVRNNWKAPRGMSVDIYGFARDEDGDVCVGPGGRLISSTSLVINPTAPLCSPARYIDALKFPGIVVPNRTTEERPVPGGDSQVAPPFASRGVRRGDLAVVYNPATSLWYGAILYDTGPREKLGEGSIHLAMKLVGRTNNPRSAEDTNSMTVRDTYTILFPGSAADIGPSSTWTSEEINRAAGERLVKWGRGSLHDAVSRLGACAEVYKSRQ